MTDLGNDLKKLIMIKGKDLKSNEIMLVVVDPADYKKVSMGMLEFLCNKTNNYGIYVALNRPFQTLLAVLKIRGINTERLFFIDCITKTTGGRQVRSDRCLYVASPNNLTDLGMSLDQAISTIPEEDKFVFVDGLSTFFVYNPGESTLKFWKVMTDRMKEWGVKGVLMSLNGEMDKSSHSQMSNCCDKIVDLTAEEEENA